MNKKGTDYVLLGLVLLILIFLSVMYDGVKHENKEKDEACQKIGFEEYELRNFDFCTDVDGNMHYIKLDSTGSLFWYKANASLISVGYVEVENGKRDGHSQ